MIKKIKESNLVVGVDGYYFDNLGRKFSKIYGAR